MSSSPFQYSLDQNLESVRHFLKNSWRWEGKIRNYTAQNIAALRGSFTETTLSHYTSPMLYENLRNLQKNGQASATFGVLDTVQLYNLSRAGLTSVYVSGWQCSSCFTSNQDFGPDFADYPSNTVPLKVQQLTRSQMLHDRKQSEELSRKKSSTPIKKINYLTPIIADADAGFGGITSVMKLVKMFVESGVAGIHLQDQRPSSKKCGHLAGKVIVSTREAMERLNAARLQADIMNVPLIIVARTDALGAKFIDSNIDPIDHPYILGVTNPRRPDELMTFIQAGSLALKKRWSIDANTNGKEQIHIWERQAKTRSLNDAKTLIKELGVEDFYFDWQASRSPQGFYPIKGSVEYCARRGIQYSRIADLLWMETPKPNLSVANEFAVRVKQKVPSQMLAYNLSPSFNWSAAGIDKAGMKTFISDLAKLGYCWQFITLAGFHMSALVSQAFVKDFVKDGMLAYVDGIQDKERKQGVEQLRHQKWSGAELRDREMSIASGGLSSTQSLDKGNTEAQFSIVPKL